MSPADFARLAPHLTFDEAAAGKILLEPGDPITTFHFVESGAASFVSPGAEEVEVGLFGRDGCVGVSLLLDVDRSPLKVTVQITGTCYSMPAAALTAATEASPALRRLLLRYVHVVMVQMASTAYANAHFSVEERLARWLLIVHDRVDGDDIALTHEFLAIMLGVRRPGVTVATHVLEGEKAIRARRGCITILDREKLKRLAGKSYGLAEVEYERLIGPMS